MPLQNDHELERSDVVANCRMNRERELQGRNSYSQDLGFDVWRFLLDRLQQRTEVAWLDLCCGTGRALRQAATLAGQLSSPGQLQLVGVDLVGGWDHYRPSSRLQFLQASLADWQPDRAFALITCVHGLHYIGDKLKLIARAASWLVQDGLFVANLDLNNVRIEPHAGSNRELSAALRDAGVAYSPRNKIVRCEGRKVLSWPYQYLGADDEAGPNYTGQPAVTSCYRLGTSS